MAKEVHVAVIGAGYWGSKLIYEYLRLSQMQHNVRLAAVVDVSRERLASVARKYGLPSSMLYTDPEFIAKREDINAVHIATPNETHYRLAEMMLESGKHVLLEKPMALSSREAFRLARLAETLGKVLLVGHIFRFNNALRYVRNRLLKGDAGKVLYLDLTWAALLNPPPPGRDIVFDLAPHPVDIVNYLLEEWPLDVYAVAESPVRGKRGLEEFAYATLRLHDNVIASIKLSWLERGPKKRYVQVVTEKETIFVDALTQEVIIYSDDGTRKVPITPSNTILEMIRHFVNTIVNGESPNNSALIGALTVVVLEAMRRSVEEGRPVRLPL